MWMATRIIGSTPTLISGRAGFTLLELVLVVGLIGIIAAVVLPRMGSTTIKKIACRSIAQRLALDQRLARDFSINTGVTHGITVASDGSSYAIYKEPGGSLVQVGETRNMSSQGALLSGNRHVAFDSKGSATTGSSSPIIVQVGASQYTTTVILVTGLVMVKEGL